MSFFVLLFNLARLLKDGVPTKGSAFHINHAVNLAGAVQLYRPVKHRICIFNANLSAIWNILSFLDDQA